MPNVSQRCFITHEWTPCANQNFNNNNKIIIITHKNLVIFFFSLSLYFIVSPLKNMNSIHAMKCVWFFVHSLRSFLEPLKICFVTVLLKVGILVTNNLLNFLNEFRTSENLHFYKDKKKSRIHPNNEEKTKKKRLKQ